MGRKEKSNTWLVAMGDMQLLMVLICMVMTDGVISQIGIGDDGCGRVGMISS